MSKCARITRLVAAMAWVAVAGNVEADAVIFSLDQPASSVTLSLSDPTYGTWVAQLPGSDVTDILGHFLVNFDPFEAGGPSSLSFQGGHGFLAFGNAAGGASLGPWNAPANFAHRTGGGELDLSFQNTVWDWYSDPIGLTAGSFDAGLVNFGILQGSYSGAPTGSAPQDIQTSDFAGFFDSLDAGGVVSLAETAPGSGDWVLSGQIAYTADLADDITGVFTGTFVARAHYGAENVADVDPLSDPTARVLGGPTQPGGVEALFNDETTPGVLSAQQIPFTGLSQSAIDAATKNNVFAISTASVGLDPQIWEVNYTGDLSGPITLVFSYDPDKLPAGLDESLLGIWHFDNGLNRWVFGGTVDADANTISFVTESLSPFALGVSIPEPASWVLALTGLALFAFLRRRTRR